MAKFEGNYEAFKKTAGSDLATNSIVTEGALVGVTRDSCANGDSIMAFMATKIAVYSLPLATTAAASADRGSYVKVSTGKIALASAGEAAIGCLWEPIAAGDKEAVVALFPSVTANGAPVASNVPALTAFGDPADTNYTATELKTEINAIITKINAFLTANKTAGLMTADSTD